MTTDENLVLLHSSSMLDDAYLSVLALKDQFSSVGLKINPTSDLGQLMQEALSFAQSPNLSRTHQELTRAVIRGQWVDRIAGAAQVLIGHHDPKPHLWRLKKGSMQPDSRMPSRAKDKLWELELLRVLNDRGVKGTLDEPDIVATTSLGPISIACKRIYSPENFETQASGGVRQLSRTDNLRILALCLDDILPSLAIIEAEHPSDAAVFLDNHNAAFLQKSVDQLARYMTCHRLSAVLASTTCPIRIPASTGRISLCTQMTIWVHPDIPDSQRQHMEEFRNHLYGHQEGIWTEVLR